MSNNNKSSNWKTQTYIAGGVLGAIFGLTAAYLYTRSAEENSETEDDERPALQTAQIISLGLAALGLIRQISEMGKAPKKKKDN